MINKEINDDDSTQITELNIDKIKENLSQYSSQKLCEMIVSDRYLGFGYNISTICMEELAKRRLAGDDFNFEGYIDQSFKALPPLDFSLKNINEALQQVIESSRKFKVR